MPGASVALVDPRGRVVCGRLGQADPAGRPFGPAPRFPIFSVAKPLLAALVLVLAQDGRVDLDAPMASLLPEGAGLTRATVRQVLNHTGGLPEYGAWSAYHAAVRDHPDRPWSAPEVLARARNAGALFAPGEGWAYSNVGYLLARLLVERLAGRPLEDALRAAFLGVWAPGGTVVAATHEDLSALTPGWSALWSGGPLEDVRARYHPGWVGHGLVASTAPELAVALDGVLRGPVLNAASRREQRRAVRVGGRHPIFGARGYGLGVMLDADHPDRIAGHGGGGPGYGAAALHLTSRRGVRVTSVALVNADRDEAALTLARALAVEWTGAAP